MVISNDLEKMKKKFLGTEFLRRAIGIFVRDGGTPQEASFGIEVSAKIRLPTFRISARSVDSGTQLLANNL
jgi:hypothetical protein